MAPAQATTVPPLAHVFVIVLENHGYSQIVGSSSAPYINGLLAKGGLATNYFAATHPSLPNYLALTGASTFGITTDCTTCWINATNIGDSLETAGKTWKAYAESMPSACFVGDSYPYAQKHNPFVYYNDIRNNSTRCKAHDVPYTQLATDLQSASTTPNYAFITPNMCNDMHDCTVDTGDRWLSQQVPTILGSPAFTTQSSLLAITWDEDDSSGANQVATILVGSGIAAGSQSSVLYDHYNLLRTAEDALGLSTLTSIDGGAAGIADFFGSNPPPPPPPPTVAPCTGASLSESQSSPAPAGTVVTLSGSASGCTNPVYRFWEQDPGSRWSMVQAYSTSASYRWTSPRISGSYMFEVDVRDAAESTAYDALATTSYVLSGGANCAGATLTLSPTAPGATGVGVTMSGSSLNCPNPVYRFWVRDPGSRWSMVQNYSWASTHAWAQTGLAGAYSLEVDVRDASETTVYDVVANLTDVISGCTAATLSPSPTGPQAANVQVTLTAGSTCPGTPQYRFWIKPPSGSWKIVWDYGATSTIVWTPPATPGTYGIEVDVRDQGATATYEHVMNIFYTIS